jgi:hypothetical protein
MVSAKEWNQSVISLEATTDIAAGICVKIASGKAAIAGTITDVVIGVTRDSALAGETVPVVTAGVASVLVSAAISEGALVGTTVTTGRGKSIAAGTDTTQYVVGVALEQATAAADLVSVLLTLGGRAA